MLIRTVRMFALAAGVAAGFAPALAQGVRGSADPGRVEVPADPTNAALVYWPAWASEDPELAGKVRDLYDSSKAIDPNGELAKLLRSNGELIARVTRASKLPECDFGIEYSEGFAAIMPHLGKMRASARLLAADAQLAAAEGRMDDAVDRIAAVYRMSHQLRDERILISSLVSPAIAGLGHAHVKTLVAGSKLTGPQAARLGEQLARFPEEDAFGMRAALRAEGVVMLEWVVRRYTGPDAGQKLVKEYLSDMGEGGQETLDMIRALNEDGVRNAAEQCRGYYVAADRVWDATDAEQQAELLMASAADLKFGPLARVFAPAVGKIVSSHRKCSKELREAADLLGSVR